MNIEQRKKWLSYMLTLSIFVDLIIVQLLTKKVEVLHDYGYLLYLVLTIPILWFIYILNKRGFTIVIAVSIFLSSLGKMYITNNMFGNNCDELHKEKVMQKCDSGYMLNFETNKCIKD